MPATRFAWDHENEAELKQRYVVGKLTYEQIAIELFGTADARSAVAGKIRRLGLTLTPGTHRRRTSETNRRRASEHRLQMRCEGPPLTFEQLLDRPDPQPTSPPPDPQYHCSIVELESDSCRGPVGDPLSDDFRFCGTPGATLPGPYCTACRRAFYGGRSRVNTSMPERSGITW